VYGHAYKILFGKAKRRYLMEELTIDGYYNIKMDIK